MNIARIDEILTDCLAPNADGSHEDEAECVDVWQVVPLIADKVRQHEDEMIELLKSWPNESWGEPFPALGQEISYIQAGSVLGDRSCAFTLFAFGKLLGWWNVLDPHSVLRLSKDDARAKQLVGLGLVSITGYRPADMAV